MDFRHDVAPVVAEACLPCHAATSGAKLDLARGSAADIYRRLVGGVSADSTRYVVPGYARNSALVWHVFGWRPDDRRALVSAMPPDTARRPGAITVEQARLIATWVDLGAQYDNRPNGVPGEEREH